MTLPFLEHSVTFYQFPDIEQNSDRGISKFQNSGQFFINKNYHNSRTSHDIGMKLGAVTKLDKRNTATSKKIDGDAMSSNFDVIVFFFLFMAHLQQSGSRIPDAWSIKLMFSLIVTFNLTTPENRTKKHSPHTILLLVQALLLPENLNF